MDIEVTELVFECESGVLSSPDLMTQFLDSGYFVSNILQMDRFLDSDKTINLEKLELGIILAVKHLEISDEFNSPIHVFLGNMGRYFELRCVSVQNIEQITEEASFILGYCKSIVQEESLSKEIIIQYESKI